MTHPSWVPYIRRIEIHRISVCTVWANSTQWGASLLQVAGNLAVMQQQQVRKLMERVQVTSSAAAFARFKEMVTADGQFVPILTQNIATGIKDFTFPRLL